jgi:hypothetical protein
MERVMKQDEWIELGVKMGWCSPPICEPHDGMPMSEEEARQYEEGSDPCVHILRLYNNEAHRLAVEAFSAQAVWRKAGWE